MIREELADIADAVAAVYKMTKYPPPFRSNSGIYIYSTLIDLLGAPLPSNVYPINSDPARVERQPNETRMTVDYAGESLSLTFTNGTILYILANGKHDRLIARFGRELHGPLLNREDEYLLGRIEDRLGGLLATLLTESNEPEYAEILTSARIVVRAGKGRLYAVKAK